MRSVEAITERIGDVAPSIESELADLAGFDEWVADHGLGRAASPESVVARQAAFYVVLVSTQHASYRSEIDGLQELTPASFPEAITGARAVTGDDASAPCFLTDAAQLFSDDDLRRLIDATRHLTDAANPAEALGSVHESLVPQEDRRKLGQFRTPPVIADLMAEWVVRDADDRVLDPGIGAAALSTSAYTTKQSRDGVSCLDEMTGVDLSPLSVLMAKVSLRLANGGGDPTLLQHDFLDLDSSNTNEVDAVISNPPYTRHHEFETDTKAEINRQIEQEAGRSVSALSPLYAYFYIHATQFLGEGGRCTFITPSEFLETNYGEDLKAFLLDNYHLRAFVLYDRDADSQFDEALTTSFISFLERKTENEGNDDELTKFIRVDEWPGQDAVIDTIEDGTEGDTEWGFVNTVRQADLDPADKWDDLYDPIEISDDERLIPLATVGNVNRGIATGRNSFFCLSESERDGEGDGFKWNIEKQYLSKLIRKSGKVPHYDYRDDDWEKQRDEGSEVWLLYHLEGLEWDHETYRAETEADGNSTLSDFASSSSDEEDTDLPQPSVVEYLKHGMSEAVGADNSYLARNRSPWYVVDRREPAPILYTYMSRSRGRFVHNKTEARNLNNLHSVYLDVDLTDAETKALLAYLNSPFTDEIVKRSGRTYSTGMDKIEPSELESVPVVDPRELDQGDVTRLAALFDDLCAASRNGDEDEVLTELAAELDAILDL